MSPEAQVRVSLRSAPGGPYLLHKTSWGTYLIVRPQVSGRLVALGGGPTPQAAADDFFQTQRIPKP